MGDGVPGATNLYGAGSGVDMHVAAGSDGLATLEVDDGTVSSTCESEVSVGDTTPPEIDCPPGMIVECDQPTDPSNTGVATATDICDSSPDISSGDTTADAACPQEYTIQRMWTATDDSGNTDDCLQTIEVVDTTSPSLSVELTPDGYVKVDQKLMTSFPGLFAAGDVRDTDMWQVLTACADGARAAKYAAEYLEQLNK